jgi:putrescine transport system substrate-binding protein
MKLFKLGGYALLGAGLSMSVQANQVVNFYNWADYVDPSVLEAFEQQSGVEVRYDVFDTNEVLETKMLTGRSGYDVVVPTGAFLERQLPAGVYLKLDKSKIPNLVNVDPDIAAKIDVHDQGGQFSVPYTWGTIGLGYNAGMLKQRLGDQALDSWDILFKPELLAKLEDCGVSMLNSPAEMVSVALNYLGLDPNSEAKSDLKQAVSLLNGIRPHIRQFSSSDYGNNLSNGDTCLAVGYNGDILMAQSAAIEADNGVELGYIIPKEGTMIWFDLMAIPADAPHPEAAYKFINFLLEPSSAAGISNYSYFAVPNIKVTPLLSESIASDPSIYPTQEVKDKLFSQKAHSPKFDRRLSREWTNFKAGI